MRSIPSILTSLIAPVFHQPKMRAGSLNYSGLRVDGTNLKCLRQIKGVKDIQPDFHGIESMTPLACTKDF